MAVDQACVVEDMKESNRRSDFIIMVLSVVDCDYSVSSWQRDKDIRLD